MPFPVGNGGSSAARTLYCQLRQGGSHESGPRPAEGKQRAPACVRQRQRLHQAAPRGSQMQTGRRPMPKLHRGTRFDGARFQWCMPCWRPAAKDRTVRCSGCFANSPRTSTHNCRSTTCTAQGWQRAPGTRGHRHIMRIIVLSRQRPDSDTRLATAPAPLATANNPHPRRASRAPRRGCPRARTQM